eukprot:scaffold4804_cov123-Cylindrotheca_fusiformis.AAC.3
MAVHDLSAADLGSVRGQTQGTRACGNCIGCHQSNGTMKKPTASKSHSHSHTLLIRYMVFKDGRLSPIKMKGLMLTSSRLGVSVGTGRTFCAVNT